MKFTVKLFGREVHLEEDDGCWVECGGRSRNLRGYVNFTFLHKGVRWQGLHRAMFLHMYGYLPDVTMHDCDNPECCNPAHLLPGDNDKNMQDAARKGRLSHGVPHVSSREKLDILNMRAKNASIVDIADRFGRDYMTVWHIIRKDKLQKV